MNPKKNLESLSVGSGDLDKTDGNAEGGKRLDYCSRSVRSPGVLFWAGYKDQRRQLCFVEPQRPTESNTPF